MADFEDGVLISENLENILYDTGYLFDIYEIDNKFKNEIIKSIKQLMREIITNYKTDKNKSFAALKKMRFETTKFQLNWQNMANKKLDESEE